MAWIRIWIRNRNFFGNHFAPPGSWFAGPHPDPGGGLQTLQYSDPILKFSTKRRYKALL